MKHELNLLCPVCQTVRRMEVVTAQLDAVEGEKFKPTVALCAHCPKCEAKMYQADTDLLEALILLNGAGFRTAFHCSGSHFDHDSDYFKDKIKYPYDARMYTRGPYILIDKMTDREIEILMELGKEYKANYTPEVEHQIEIEVETHKVEKLNGRPQKIKNRVEINVMSRVISEDSMRAGCRILTQFVEAYLKRVFDGEIPSDRGHKLTRIANTCWVEAYESNGEYLDED